MSQQYIFYICAVFSISLHAMDYHHSDIHYIPRSTAESSAKKYIAQDFLLHAISQQQVFEACRQFLSLDPAKRREYPAPIIKIVLASTGTCFEQYWYIRVGPTTVAIDTYQQLMIAFLIFYGLPLTRADISHAQLQYPPQDKLMKLLTALDSSPDKPLTREFSRAARQLEHHVRICQRLLRRSREIGQPIGIEIIENDTTDYAQQLTEEAHFKSEMSEFILTRQQTGS